MRHDYASFPDQVPGGVKGQRPLAGFRAAALTYLSWRPISRSPQPHISPLSPKAREVRTRISEALGVIDKAFQRQVEALDEYRFIDLESEMDVLRDMLRSDGLVDDEQEADPFADVLGRTDQRENGAGTPMATH